MKEYEAGNFPQASCPHRLLLGFLFDLLCQKVGQYMIQVWHETIKQFGDKPACRRHFSFFGYFFLPFQKMEKKTNISAVSLHYLSLMNLMIYVM